MTVSLVTGATGFVGGHLIARLRREGESVRAAVRSPSDKDRLPEGVWISAVGDLGPETDWSESLRNVDVVYHLAARVHQMGKQARTLAAFRSVNVQATKRLFDQAAEAGVETFVHVSSIKAVGEGGRRPLTENDPARPEEPYGVSKREAEMLLTSSATRAAIRLVILRPPLIYGPGAKGNMSRLMAACDRGWPLPLGSVAARRSLIYVGNLVDALYRVANSEKARGTYFVKDLGDPTVAALCAAIAEALGKPDRALSVPPSILRLALFALGKKAESSRLLESFLISDDKIRGDIHWSPPFDLTAGLSETAAWFRTMNPKHDPRDG